MMENRHGGKVLNLIQNTNIYNYWNLKKKEMTQAIKFI